MATRELPVELFYDPEDLESQAPRLRAKREHRRRWWDWRSLRFDTGLKLIARAKRLVPGRKPPVELFYDLELLDPDAPRLRISKCAGVWELRDDQGALLSSHARLPAAIDDALARSAECYSEILVMAATGRFQWSVQHNPDWLELARIVNQEPKPREGRWWDWKYLRFDTGLRLIVRSKRLVAGREPPLKLYYDVRELDPGAPRLRISKSTGIWELRDDQDSLLGSHDRLPDAIDAALCRSEVCFSEILVMASNGRFEWSVRHNPELLEIARVVARPVAVEREAAD